MLGMAFQQSDLDDEQREALIDAIRTYMSPQRTTADVMAELAHPVEDSIHLFPRYRILT